MHRLEERLIPCPITTRACFDELPPALVVSGDPLRPGDANLIAAARQRGVPSLGSVRSWDNIQKHLRTRPDALTVWNALQRARGGRDRPLSSAQVSQVGAPQLDVYFPRPNSARADLGLDPRKKTLLLATSSFTYDSDQTYLVDMLARRDSQRRDSASACKSCCGCIPTTASAAISSTATRRKSSSTFPSATWPPWAGR